MRRGFCIVLFAFWLANLQAASADTVDAAQYDAFWIWAGVKPQAVVQRARTIYVLQGQIQAAPGDESQVRFIAQGATPPDLPQARLQLPFRIGIIQGGVWQAPPYLDANPWFRGYVVFLRDS